MRDSPHIPRDAVPAGRRRRPGRGGAFCLILLLFLCVSAVLPQRASAEVYDEAIAKLSEWGILRGYSDGLIHPERAVTRAQFLAMLNRAYGYSDAGKHPFKDVPDTAWYADDVAIAYTAGYFVGTEGGASATEASAEELLTREQAMTMLCRNMRLDSIPGEITEFTDSDNFSDFSKGYVKAAYRKGVIAGYPDGSFCPKNNISRGAMSLLLYRALGTLVNEPGLYELGDVFGNVTISNSGTTLRNTTVAGDLYISGGLGLGSVTLDNVRTLGSIVIAGTGESEAGDESVILRNVNTDYLQVDSLAGQYLSLRAEGNTSVEETSVRTQAYVQDQTPTGGGLKTITLEGVGKSNFTLTGNLENVVNKSPESSLIVAAGTAQTLTMDELGAGAKLNIDGTATVKNLNLDTGTAVSGGGDVESLIVNTAGSSSTMLPDNITVRPGLTSRISGTQMDTAVAQEASDEPRLLAGYPRVTNLAPTTATAIFSSNKAGTVYWAISGTTDGSIEEEELVNPKPYGSKAILNGSNKISTSNKEVSAAFSKLTAGGSYYLSAVMVDVRGTRSPVKVTAFSTPDGTVPAFASGYPTLSYNDYDHTSEASDRFLAQYMVMANKTCQMYWAIYNAGGAVPSVQEFRAGSLDGSIAHGVMEMTRNVPNFLELAGLEETTSYDVFMWLTDADFARSAQVKKFTFKTVDGTPPRFLVNMSVTSVRANALGMTCTLNEAGTVYWVVVKSGAEFPKPAAGSTNVTPEYAVMQIAAGMNGEKSGSVKVRANTAANFNISGLAPETSYDIWYIARDNAGNYSVYPAGDPNNPEDPDNPRLTCMLNANTLDNIAPTCVQEFTRFLEDDPGSPYADTDIRLVFSENIQKASTGEAILNLYQAIGTAETESAKAEARDTLANALRTIIALYDRTSAGLPKLVLERNSSNESIVENWVIDYRNARVEMNDGKLIVVFPTTNDARKDSALRLKSGSVYYFQLEDIADTSTAKNTIRMIQMPRFRTISAQVAIEALSLAAANYPDVIRNLPVVSDRAIDMGFALTPISTSMADPSATWDVVLWSDTSCVYEVYARRRKEDSTTYEITDETDTNGWRKVQDADGGAGKGSVTIPSTQRGQLIGQSLMFNLYGLGVGETPRLAELDDTYVYEYAIRFLEVNGDEQRTGWSQEVHFYISVLSGSSVELGNLAANITQERFATAKSEEYIYDIGTPGNMTFRLTKSFLDTVAPIFSSGRPIFNPGDVYVEMRLQISRQGTVFYAIAPADGTITTRDLNGVVVDWDRRNEIPTSGSEIWLDDKGNAILDENNNEVFKAPFYVRTPPYLEIVNPEYDNNDIVTGTVPITSGSVTVEQRGLAPETDYFAYFVIKGTGQTYSEFVEIYRFTTTEVVRPVITLDLANPIVNISADREAETDYMVVNYTSTALSSLLTNQFWDAAPTGRRSMPTNYPSYANVHNVLEAMATNVAATDNGGKGSVFDVYADDDYKEQLAEYIRASSSNTVGTIIGVGHGITVAPGRRVTVDCSEFPMSDRTQYAFLAVGRNPQGSGNAFRAIYPLALVDNQHPMVTMINSTLNIDLNADGDQTRFASGRVSLTFDESLYRLDTSTSPPELYQLDRGPILSDTRDAANLVKAANNEPRWMSVGTIIQSMTTTGIARVDTEDDAYAARATQVIDVEFNHAGNGEYVTFASDLCDQFSNVGRMPLYLRVNIAQVTTQIGVKEDTGEPLYGYIYTPTVEISSEWDGRGLSNR